MKKIHLTFFLIFLSYHITIGQNFSKEFGKIEKDEFEVKYEDAEAIVLFDIAKSYFVESQNSFNVIFERKTRIKIFSEAGIKWAEVEIPFYQEGGVFEKIYDIEAYTYNYEDGQIHKTPFSISNIYDTKINNQWKLRKFAIPNVKAGSIIEYKYKISSQYKFNLRDWEFQWKIPVIYSEYEVKMIPFYEYSYLLQGVNKFDTQTSYVEKGLSRHFGSVTFKDVVYKYIMKDVAAFKDEKFITSMDDYIIKLDFQLSKIHYPDGGTVNIMTTWEEMIKELIKHKDFGKYIKKTEKLAPKLINTGSLNSKTDREKFDFVLNYVKRNINWNNNNGKYATKPPNKLVKEKYGNSADINLFTIGLLNSLGLEAYPILISTREHGKIKYDYPFSHFFNYVLILANIDGGNILSDATETLNLNDRIPESCINDKGLIIKKDKVEWVGLECSFFSEIKTEILMDIINAQTIHASISKALTEYDALHYRYTYTDKIDNIKKKLNAKGYSLIDSSISVQNQHDKEKPYILNYNLTEKAETFNDKVYISPFLNELISDNPLKQKERTYPIDMTYPRKRVFKTTIRIPEGYQVDFLPKEQRINNHQFELNYKITTNTKNIVISFDYYFKESIYPSNDYSKIKFFFNEIVNKGNEKIVLSKKVVEK